MEELARGVGLVGATLRWAKGGLVLFTEAAIPHMRSVPVHIIIIIIIIITLSFSWPICPSFQVPSPLGKGKMTWYDGDQSKFECGGGV